MDIFTIMGGPPAHIRKLNGRRFLFWPAKLEDNHHTLVECLSRRERLAKIPGVREFRLLDDNPENGRYAHHWLVIL